MEKKYQVLLSKLEGELEKFGNMEPLQRMQGEVLAVRGSLEVLKGVVLADGFVDGAAEVAFFKSVKPLFLSKLVLAVERYGMERCRPVRPGKGLERFYQNQLDYIERSFVAYGFFYEYFRMGACELDLHYFMRGVEPIGFFARDLPEMDAAFATVGDYLFARFMALEVLKEGLVAELRGPAAVGSVVRSKKGRELKWTGDSVNLIEVVYGIFDCRQVNGGDVDISDLMDVFEQCFQVNLSRYFRRFTEIKRRKSVSRTRFLDEMKAAVEKRIDDGDAYVPMSMR